MRLRFILSEAGERGYSSGSYRRVLAVIAVFCLLIIHPTCARHGGPVPKGESTPVEVQVEKGDEIHTDALLPKGEEIIVDEGKASNRQSLLYLSGNIIDEGKNPLPGVTIEIRRIGSLQSIRSIISDESGRFKIQLAPGTYLVAATMQGFSRKTLEVTLQPGSAMNLQIELGGPVPTGEVVPKGKAIPTGEPAKGDAIATGEPAKGDAIAAEKLKVINNAINVLERSFANDTDLHIWLNEQSDQRKIVTNVFPLRSQTSLFVIKTGISASYTVIAVDGELSRDKVQKYINLNNDKTLIGIHLINQKYLLIFRNK